MTIKYETDETGIIYCISQDCIFQGRRYDELLWAEIQQNGNDYVLRWEDDFSKAMTFPIEGAAKSFVENNHLLHKPHVNGASYELRAIKRRG